MTPHAMAAIQGNSERRAQKRLRPSTKSSILAEAKGSALASDHSTENEVAREPCQLSAPGVSLKEAADTVVRCLTPFYKEGRFTSKVSRVGLEYLGQCRGVVGGKECAPMDGKRQSRAGQALTKTSFCLLHICLALGGSRAPSSSLCLLGLV